MHGVCWLGVQGARLVFEAQKADHVALLMRLCSFRSKAFFLLCLIPGCLRGSCVR